MKQHSRRSLVFTFLLFSLLALAIRGQQGGSSEEEDRFKPGRPGGWNAGLFPRPSFPDQNQGRPGRPNEDGGQFPQPSFPDQNQGRPNQSTTQPPEVPNEGGVIFKVACPCPTIANYNPVCGTNNKTYANPSVLRCAGQCGTDVQLRKQGSCGSNRS